eukprot:CAMPEP_0114309490 /NCGR_PEP_ID=MMETSP0059-20121206/18663_1 /TAXON_ID=36894 /ORGANISM="Pyramimonas parkeae, Strain CCMP726" /LENGTH=540 /DNA_ID=CAMNT_0001433289 /DNA_START=37 /DNA_END=1660 /DNA_ORIENTATION=-
MSRNAGFDMQFQIRQNSLEMSEFISGLNDWTSEVSEKDKALKMGKVKKQSGEEETSTKPPLPTVPPVRGRVSNTVKKAMPSANPESAKRDAKRKLKAEAKAKAAAEAKTKATAAGHTYDYFKDKWDKFDVDKALEEVDEQSSEDESQVKSSSLGSGKVPRGPGDIAAGQCFEQPEVAEVVFDPEEEKNLGNELYKKGDYGGAVGRYSNSIKAKPSAEGQLLGPGVGARVRESVVATRYSAQALEKYLASVEDFEMAVRWEPNSSVHAQERLTSQNLLIASEKLSMSQPRTLLTVHEIPPEKISNFVADEENLEAKTEQLLTPVGEPTTQTKPEAMPAHPGISPVPTLAKETATTQSAAKDEVPMEAGISGQDSSESRQEEPVQRKSISELAESAAAKMEAKQVEKARKAAMNMPKSGLEFERSWKAISKDDVAQTEFLKALDGSKLPHIFKDSLSASIVCTVLRALLPRINTAEEDSSRCAHWVGLLEGLTKVPRFDMTVMFLTGKEKKELQLLWDTSTASLAGTGLEGKIQGLRKKYKL